MGTGFAGQTAVVTGATSGIGRAIALALADEGATVCAVGRQPGSLRELADAGLLAYPADLRHDDAVEVLVARLFHDHPAIDVLVHGAGDWSRGTVADACVEELDRLHRLNVRVPFRLTQALLPRLRAGPGQVVFVNSSAGLHAGAGTSQYAATKHALKAIADSLRSEVNGDGVRVLSVFPGRTATPMQRRVCRAEGRPYQAAPLLQPSDVAAAVVGALALPRTAAASSALTGRTCTVEPSRRTTSASRCRG